MDWIFQANPKRYDLLAAIAGGIDRNWSMNQGRKFVSPGDRVFFLVAGPNRRLLAVGRVTSPVYERDSQFGEHAVDVSYDYSINPPLTVDEIKDMGPPLSAFKPFFNFQGTNFRIQSSEISAALDAVLQSRLVPLSQTMPVVEVQTSQIDLDKAIKNARRESAHALQKNIAAMDPTAFEWLISALLTSLGYEEITVTKQSNDGGIDLRAKLVAGGIANIETAVQVKKTQSVGRPVVQNLRGSLTAHESGLLVTSGHFTDGAREEAKAVSKAPIALIDGPQLVELLLEHGIGAKQKIYKVYSLDPESLLLENLKARAQLKSSSDEAT